MSTKTALYQTTQGDNELIDNLIEQNILERREKKNEGIREKNLQDQRISISIEESLKRLKLYIGPRNRGAI